MILSYWGKTEMLFQWNSISSAMSCIHIPRNASSRVSPRYDTAQPLPFPQAPRRPASRGCAQGLRLALLSQL